MLLKKKNAYAKQKVAYEVHRQTSLWGPMKNKGTISRTITGIGTGIVNLTTIEELIALNSP
jgi:hypothetical protein